MQGHRELLAPTKEAASPPGDHLCGGISEAHGCCLLSGTQKYSPTQLPEIPYRDIYCFVLRVSYPLKWRSGLLHLYFSMKELLYCFLRTKFDTEKTSNVSHLRVPKERKRFMPGSPENSLFDSEMDMQEVYKGLPWGTGWERQDWTGVALKCNAVATEALALQLRVGGQAFVFSFDQSLDEAASRGGGLWAWQGSFLQPRATPREGLSYEPSVSGGHECLCHKGGSGGTPQCSLQAPLRLVEHRKQRSKLNTNFPSSPM